MRFKTVYINFNPKLTEIDFTALTAVPDGTTATALTLANNANNALSGTYSYYVAATETTAAVETVIKNDDVNSFKPYVTALAATGVNTPTIAFAIEQITAFSTRSES